jgi:hypothetical protein
LKLWQLLLLSPCKLVHRISELSPLADSRIAPERDRKPGGGGSSLQSSMYVCSCCLEHGKVEDELLRLLLLEDVTVFVRPDDV